SADGSWGFPPVRVGRRQAILKRSAILAGLFCFLFNEKQVINNKVFINYGNFYRDIHVLKTFIIHC
ncbi:hypothetical protein LAV79_21625, partial [Peribacillus butanolivorans]|uniref:hypothetical protein n=1 Tax=Peribacillus butanolivorans TaxID=421767 RepID=UPI0030C9CE75